MANPWKIGSNKMITAPFGYASKYFIGGYTPNPLKNSTTFAGLQENELNVSQFIKVNLSLQTNLASKIYLIPHVDVAAAHSSFASADVYRSPSRHC
jgi:NTE family protein